jgi:TonB-dependent SusC/RagA subfamily outer membrane receptor
MKKLFTFMLLSATLFFGFINDEDLLKKIVSYLEKFNLEYPQEKAYLHLDKPYYSAGESLWFKAYLTEGMTNFPDTISVPLYVELIDNQAGKLIDQRIIKLEGGFGYGDFQLADSLRAGFYRLRAYTSWMRNFDEELMFTKDFKVYRAGEEPPVKLNAQDIDFQFFPEGGYLVEGIESRLAFKAADATGKGIPISGYLLSTEGDTVMNFQSEHLGMGFFRFKPEAGKSYYADIKYQNIYNKRFEIPEVKKQGYTLAVDNTSNKTLVRVFITNNTTNPNAQMLLIGQSRGVALYAGKAQTGKKMSFISIPKDKFPAGVVQFTLFDESLKPQCERVVFMEPTKQLNISIKPDKDSYKTREKTNLDIEVKDNEGKPVEGNFSLVVSDSKQIKEVPNDETILTYLLLSSDVKGKIEQPNYYFDKSNKNAGYYLDILMLAQGWRRFKWEDVIKETLPKTNYVLENGLTVTGEAVRQNGKAFEKPVNLSLMIKPTNQDIPPLFGMGEAGKDGTFAFYGLDFRDSCKILVQAVAGQNNRNTKITIDNEIHPKIKIVKIPYGIVEIDEKELADYLKRTRDALELEKRLKFEKAIALSEITVKAKREKEEKDSRVIYGAADATVVVGENTYGALNVFDLLRGRVAGVQVGGDPFNPTIQIRGISSISLSSEPLFLLDGVPITKESILSINVNDVEKIDVLKGPSASMYGSQGSNGVISVLTKRGNSNYDWNKDEAFGIKVAARMGYATSREFFVPKYDQDLPENVRPDYRSTVFWAPMIKTDKEGKAKVSYFNTDAETTMKISIEGLSLSGIPAANNKVVYGVKK